MDWSTDMYSIKDAHSTPITESFEEVESYFYNSLCQPLSQIVIKDGAAAEHLPEIPCLYNTTPVPQRSAILSTSGKEYAKGCKGPAKEEFVTDFHQTEPYPWKVINFVDLDNKGTLYRSNEERKQREKIKKKKRRKELNQESDFAKDLVNVGEEKLKLTRFRNFYSLNLEKEHLNTAAVMHLKKLDSFEEEEVGKVKNAADAKMLVAIIVSHCKVDLNVGFNIMSGDRGFECIMQEFFGRKVQSLSLHPRHDHNDMTVEKVVAGPTEDMRNVNKTELGKCIDKLDELENITKVYFVHAPPDSMPIAHLDLVKHYLEDPKSAILIFRMEQEGVEPILKLDAHHKDRLHIFKTDKEKKQDAPLFLLVCAALFLHYKPIDREVEFNIITKEENAFVMEIENNCYGRKVNLNKWPSIAPD